MQPIRVTATRNSELQLEEAAAAGLPVAGAGHGGDVVSRAVAAGVRTIEHGALLTDAEIDAMIRYGATLVLTPARFFHPRALSAAPPQHGHDAAP